MGYERKGGCSEQTIKQVSLVAFPPLSYMLHTVKGELSASAPPSSAAGDFLPLCILCASAASSFEPNPNALSGERNTFSILFFLKVQFQ